MSLLGDVGQGLEDVGSSALDAITGKNNNQLRSFEQDGFSIPPMPSASGDGLPSSKIPSQHTGETKRHIIHWFVPEVGVINMYVNPKSIDYKYSKVITPERTKGGYVIQYWGENLTTLSIRGTTGSSGIEGINVLCEIYRSEQLTFDAIGLTMASDATLSGIRDILGTIGSLGSIGSDITSTISGVLGGNPLTQTILPRNPATLASLAFGIELYYNGKVFRGFFNNFSFTESADMMGMFEYNIEFIVTQSRGYRINEFGWQHSATQGPSNNGIGGAPLSYKY